MTSRTEDARGRYVGAHYAPATRAGGEEDRRLGQLAVMLTATLVLLTAAVLVALL